LFIDVFRFTCQVTIMFETQDPCPEDMIEDIKARAESLRRNPTKDIISGEELASLPIPEKQIEQGSFQRFTQAERSRGGESRPRR
jgi:hypothetical protein